MPFGRLYLPEMLLAAGRAHGAVGLLVDPGGRVAGLATADAVPAGTERIALPGKAILPGLANAHSHTFQRLFRGRAEGRADAGDSFWTWRERMYRAARFLSPEDLYDVARATFLEMACSGVTAVGEFHYLHRDRDGRAYSDPNLLSRVAIDAALSVGLRICLLRSAYLRAGWERAPHPGQARFYETAEEYLENLEALAGEYRGSGLASVGAAPHSIRAVPLAGVTRIAEFARGRMPLHLHIAEQVAENAACVAEYGRTPVALMAEHGILSPATTLVHAIHLTPAEFEATAASGATICSCPSTERNLGDGIFPADRAAALGIPVALGSDSQAQIDILEDARQLEYHLRLRDQRRSILDLPAGEFPDSDPCSAGWPPASMGDRLYRSASANGYRALGLAGGALFPGEPADFFTVDLEDPSILGVDPGSLTAQAVFALAKTAIRDVAVQGEFLITDGRHARQAEIRLRYRSVQSRFEAGTT